MTATTTAVGWAPIIKSEKRSDGTLVITGKAADSNVDRDYQIADEAWLDTAMSKWFGAVDGGNIREQHDPKRAIGSAVHYEKRDDGGHYITAEIVDPIAVMKIERNVLKGFSWSARNAAVKSDKGAPGGRVYKGDIYELSVVDRPANPGCLIEIAKADGNGDLQLVESPEFVELGNGTAKADEPKFTPTQFAHLLKNLGKSPEVESALSKADEDDEEGDGEKKPGHQPARYRPDEKDTIECPSCHRMNAPDAKHCDQCGYKLKGNPDVKGDGDGDANKVDAMYGDELHKFVSADKRREYADKGIAMPNGDFPIPDEGHLRSAIGHLGGYTGDKIKAKAHIIKRARALGKTNLLPDDWGVSKAFDAVDALTKHLDEAGIELSKVDTEAAMEEGDDISDGKAAIAAIARLIIAEAEELAEGHLGEIDDIQMLTNAAYCLRCFIGNEGDALVSYSAPTESAMKTDTRIDTDKNADTGVDTSVTKTIKGSPTGELTTEDLSTMLNDTITKAIASYKNDLDVVKGELAKVLGTVRQDGPARLRTPAHTVIAAKADALRAEIAHCEKAVRNYSGDLRKGYRQRLEDAQAELKKLDDGNAA